MALAFNNEPVLRVRRQVGNTSRILMMLALSALIASRAAAALTPSTWAFESGGPTSYPADTVGGKLSSASLVVASPNGGMISRQTTGGNPNGFLQIAGSPPTQVGGSTLTFTLTRTAQANFSLTTLTFNYNLIGTKPPSSITWSYNFGGSSFTLPTTTLNQASGWQTTGSVDLSGVTGFGASGTINIVGTIVDASTGNGNTGTIGFDNFAINAVPEPVNVALAAFGLCLVSVGVGRRVYTWARAQFFSSSEKPATWFPGRLFFPETSSAETAAEEN